MLSGEHPFDQVPPGPLRARAWRRHDGRRAALLSSGERRGPSTARADLRRARLLRLRGAAQTARVCVWGEGGGGQDAGISDLFRQITAGAYSFRPEVKAPSSLPSL